MCGICGQYNFRNHEPVESEKIKNMAAAIVHRGPDDEGFYISGPLGFGFRRLSIIDLQGGHQPMTDKEKKIWVVFNGEIYNFPQLKQELEGYGHVFQNKSDTEVIIHGYKQWGIDVFDRLNGMFGLAIWDDVKKRLILARDPMGIKFIYYKIENGSVFFASEIRSIIAASKNKSDIDPQALNLFLRYRYTPSPLTLLKGIRKLPSGNLLIFENGKYTLKRWYKYKPAPFENISDDEAQEELTEIYKRAVKRHLLSDVPVGLLLSGGIDSGLLLGLMKQNGENWPTYTVGYGKKFKSDELDDAAETARYFTAKNFPVELSRETFENALPGIISCLEEPIASSSIVPMYFVCKRAREDVKVALIGQGPDELFGGYTRHIGVRYGNYWRKMPGGLRSPIIRAINSLPRNEAFKRGVYALDIPEKIRRYQYVLSIMPGELIDSLFLDGMLPQNSGDLILECWSDIEPLMGNTDELGGFNFLEIRSTLPDELLMYADKLSMAHSLEVRVPYLDREIVEFTERLREHFKIRKGSRKWIHRKICAQFLPESIIKRKKRGFAVNVVDTWFHKSLSGKMDNIFSDNNSLMYQYFQPHKIQKLLKEHKSGENDNYKILFSLIVFEEWLRLGF